MKYIRAILSLASVGMLFYIIYDQKQQIKDLQSTTNIVEQNNQRIDSLQQVADSLSNEILQLKKESDPILLPETE